MNNNYMISIPKNLKKIQSKLFFGLTKRQLIGFGVGAVLGIIVFLMMKNINLDIAMYSLFIVVAPMVFATIYKKDEMYVEQWIKLMIEQKYLNPQKRTYKVTNRNYQLAQKRRIIPNENFNQSKPRRKKIKENESLSGITTTNKS